MVFAGLFVGFCNNMSQFVVFAGNPVGFCRGNLQVFCTDILFSKTLS